MLPHRPPAEKESRQPGEEIHEYLAHTDEDLQSYWKL